MIIGMSENDPSERVGTPTAAERVVMEAIRQVREDTHPDVTGKPQTAILPVVRARTGASYTLYVRALRLVNAEDAVS
jgi:hypothetical protein